MDEYRAGETNAVVLAGMCTALAVVLSVIGFYMPLVSLVVFLLIPLPIAYLGMKEGDSWSIIVTAGIMILDSVFFGFISAAFLCAIFGVLGVVLGICYRNKVSAAATLAAGAVVVLAALIGQAFAAMYILNVPPMIFGGEAMDSMEQQMMAQMAQFYSGELLMQTQENVKQMIDDIRRSIPVITVSAAFFYTWASMMLGKKIFTRLGMKDIPGMPPLERWELPRFFLGLYVLAFAMQYITNRNATLEMIQYNLGLACVLIFWLQGLAALWWMPRKYPFVRPLRWIIAVLSVIIGMVQMIVVLLGLSDMVLQYRKKRNYE
ncbi:YybS family protein [Dialister invisus]|uniref:YybS family protein n=1 Tax=Dialister invisus TaxID=218538 RepID=UPI00307CC0D0